LRWGADDSKTERSKVMSTNPAAPLLAEEAATFRRPGRALIGWMPTDRGAIALAGGHREGAFDKELIERVEAAHNAVSDRPAGIDQDGIVDEEHDSIVEIVDRLQNQPDTAAFWNEGWSVAVVDLARVCSLQQSVASQQAEERVSEVDPDDLVSIGEVTLPRPATDEIPMQYDEQRKAWIISAPNPNLRITGFAHVGTPNGPLCGFHFGILPSFLQVARHHGRYVLRDGYHRAYGLLARGITRAPAFVRDYGIGALGTSPGLFTTDVYLSDRPPLLDDFRDDDVAADVDVPVAQKMIVIQGLELSPLA
jgi:hypothetical protein